MWGLNESSLAAIEKTRAEVEASQEQKEAILGTKADLERGRSCLERVHPVVIVLSYFLVPRRTTHRSTGE